MACTLADLAHVKLIAPRLCFFMHTVQICHNGGKRLLLLAETIKLGVIAVTLGAAAKYLLRKQRFAPQRDQALGVKVHGMQ